MDADRLLTTTRSARRSLDVEAPVDLAEVRECLAIALQAANGSNQQTWRWVVVADAALRTEVATLYRDAYLAMTGGQLVSAALGEVDDFGRLMSSTEWLVEHLADVPLLVIPCYQPYLPRFEADESFQQATLYGSVFPAVWNLQLALHSRGYGSCLTTMHLLREREVQSLLGIPDGFRQCCLLPVARLRAGRAFGPARRRPTAEVVCVDGWDGPPL